jgi:hypothetical protein
MPNGASRPRRKSMASYTLSIARRSPTGETLAKPRDQDVSGA